MPDKPDTKEVTELYNVAVSIHRNPKINVIIDNTLPTAYTDYQNIYLTKQLAPRELWKYKHVMQRFLDGEVIHEATHIDVSRNITPHTTKWKNNQLNYDLADAVHGTLEDARINQFALSLHRFDFAYRLKFMYDVMNHIWIDTLKQKLQQQHINEPYRPESHFLDKMLIPLSQLKGMFNWDIEKDFKLTKKQLEFINQSTKIIKDGTFDMMPVTIIARHNQLYAHWNVQVTQQKHEDPKENSPANLGGNLKMISGKETSKFIRKLEKDFKDEEKKNAQEDKSAKNASKFGKGSGLNIPTPQPNEAEYEKLAANNSEHIEHLLELMKQLATPNLTINSWQREGRLMTEILAKAYVSSLKRPMQNIYQTRTVTYEKAEVVLGMIVDLSGSVDLTIAKNALTIISETAGRWLLDQNFATIVFGSDYQLIKAYVEPYHTTRNRIGGVEDMGGTEMYQPLLELYKMTREQAAEKKKIVIIVSDFDTDKKEECKQLIKTMEENGINVVGLGVDNCTEHFVKTFCQKAKYIGSIQELPENVFALYSAAAL